VIGVSAGRAASLAVIALAVTGGLAACGDDQTYAAEELVSALNDHGAGLELGEDLPFSREGLDVRALRFAGEPSAPVPAGGEEEGGSGSLTITEDADAGLAEFQRCEQAGAFVCFRADNAVLIFEDELAPADRARPASALDAIAAD
jgi:hypothetical protein